MQKLAYIDTGKESVSLPILLTLCSTSPKTLRGCLCPYQGSNTPHPTLHFPHNCSCHSRGEAATLKLCQMDELLNCSNHWHQYSDVSLKKYGQHVTSLTITVIINSQWQSQRDQSNHRSPCACRNNLIFVSVQSQPGLGVI